MAAGEIHVGDIGTVFEFTFLEDAEPVDISAAQVLQATFRKPDGTTVTKSGTLSTDGQDGKMRYVTVTSDLDMGGQWSTQGFVRLPTGEWHSDVAVFDVYRNLA